MVGALLACALLDSQHLKTRRLMVWEVRYLQR